MSWYQLLAIAMQMLQDDRDSLYIYVYAVYAVYVYILHIFYTLNSCL